MAEAPPSLVVIGPDGERPFMRGILVQSLVSRGVPFEVALETASRISDRITGQGRVRIEELSAFVEEELGGRFDLDVSGYRVEEPPVVVGAAGLRGSPFSKGLLAISLQGAGMDPSDAFDVAREVASQMLREGVKQIERPALRARVAATIERTHGTRAAERYQTWRTAIAGGRPILVLLGGATGVGKTSIAIEVARRLEITHVVGTDSIRQIMRLMFSPDLMPEIHGSTFDVYRALRLRGGAAAPLLAAFREQAKKVAVGVHGLLDRAVEENIAMIIEGVNLLPSVLHLDQYRERAHVISLVVTCLDHADYRSRFATRAEMAQTRTAEHYLRHFREILSIQSYILEEAEALDVPIIDNIQFDDAVQSVIRSVISTLAKSLPVAGELQKPT